jgi:hypothetical protein
MIIHSGDQTIFVDGRIGKRKIPRSKDGLCTHCHRRLEDMYGFCDDQGIGCYRLCTVCGRTFDFVEDKD